MKWHFQVNKNEIFLGRIEFVRYSLNIRPTRLWPSDILAGRLLGNSVDLMGCKPIYDNISVNDNISGWLRA